MIADVLGEDVAAPSWRRSPSQAGARLLVAYDVSDERQVRGHGRRSAGGVRRLDILVNDAGIVGQAASTS